VSTFGERAVGLSFNPSGDPMVDGIKRSCADLIDALEKQRFDSQVPEAKRMLSLAITKVQEGQMWTVKAVTWRDE
jgi:hypothetical protein